MRIDLDEEEVTVILELIGARLDDLAGTKNKTGLEFDEQGMLASLDMDLRAQANGHFDDWPESAEEQMFEAGTAARQIVASGSVEVAAFMDSDCLPVSRAANRRNVRLSGLSNDPIDW